MKRSLYLLILAVLSGCCNMPQSAAPVERKAYVARVPDGNLEAVRELCSELDVNGGRGGIYLREIEGETYLFQYLEIASRDGHKHFQPLEKYLGAGSACPMERIFYEEGAVDQEPEGEVTRIAMFTELKPEKEKDYRLLHDNPWPDVIAAIRRANFRHFSIFLEEIGGKLYLFGWLEYVGSDIAADDAINKRDPASIRWWRETDACQIAPPDAGGGMWGGMEELVFFGKE
jgi:L-rhamnose mutarotase